KSKICNFRSFPISEGILPDNLLFRIFRFSKLIRFPIPRGMFPNILFSPRLKKTRVVEKLAMHLGNSPPKLLRLISNLVRYVEFVKEQRKLKPFTPPFPSSLRATVNNETLYNFSKEGALPLSLLSVSSSSFRFEALDIEIRIGPVNWLVPMTKFSILGRVIPISDGRCPWIWLSPT
ncbi:hypothetical protein ACB092_11G212500, partial [Castanea dentata]